MVNLDCEVPDLFQPFVSRLEYNSISDSINNQSIRIEGIYLSNDRNKELAGKYGIIQIGIFAGIRAIILGTPQKAGIEVHIMKTTEAKSAFMDAYTSFKDCMTVLTPSLG
jgi:hypothetical protein